MKKNTLKKMAASLILSLTVTSVSAQGWMNCEDFTATPWPSQTFFSQGDTMGYTQGNYPVVLGNGAFCYFNDNPSDEGMYLIGPVDFGFDGSDQDIRFEIYGFYNQFNQMGFSVNGSATTYMNSTFPLTIGTTTVDLDTTIANSGNWEYVHLTFSGNVTDITIEGFESGITEMCTRSNSSSMGCDNFASSSWPSQTSFTSGDVIGYVQNGTQPVELGSASSCLLNGITPGILLDGRAHFGFDDTQLSAEFIVYENDTEFNELGFSINGSMVHYLDESFPQTVNGVTIDLDNSVAPLTNHLYASLTFTGVVSDIDIIGESSGIKELCVGTVAGAAEKQHEEFLKVSPNPANDWLNVSSNELIKSVKLHSLSGEVVQSFDVTLSKEQRLDVSHVNPGVYILDVELNNLLNRRVKFVVR